MQASPEVKEATTLRQLEISSLQGEVPLATWCQGLAVPFSVEISMQGQGSTCHEIKHTRDLPGLNSAYF